MYLEDSLVAWQLPAKFIGGCKMKRFALWTVTFLLLPLGIAFSNEHDKASTSKKMTVTGCLEQGQAGTFMLRNESGKEIMLAPDTAKLSKHVNHTVKLTGKYSGKEAKSDGEHASDLADMKFKVANVEHVSDTCMSSTSPVRKANPNQ